MLWLWSCAGCNILISWLCIIPFPNVVWSFDSRAQILFSFARFFIPCYKMNPIHKADFCTFILIRNSLFLENVRSATSDINIHKWRPILLKNIISHFHFSPVPFRSILSFLYFFKKKSTAWKCVIVYISCLTTLHAFGHFYVRMQPVQKANYILWSKLIDRNFMTERWCIYSVFCLFRFVF